MSENGPKLPSYNWLREIWAFVGFVFLTTTAFYGTVKGVRWRLQDVNMLLDGTASEELDVWLVTLGLLGATAVAVAAISISSMRSLWRDASSWPRTVWPVWAAAAALMLLLILVSVGLVREVIDLGDLSDDVERSSIAFNLAVGVCAVPALMYFFALRFVASKVAVDNENIDSSDFRCVLELRRRLQRHLAALGLLLTLIVIATALGRRALVAHSRGEEVHIPVEQVLFFGMAFAALLAVLYVWTSNAIADATITVLDVYAPVSASEQSSTTQLEGCSVPASNEEETLDQLLERRSEISMLLKGGAGVRQSIETAIIILSPLLAAIIGALLNGGTANE